MTKGLKKEAEKCAQEMLFWLHLPINEKNVKDGGSHILELLEPRENRIEELEKENAELKEQITLMQDAECSSCTTLGSLQIKINDLEKENAGLKARLNAINLLTPELKKAAKLRIQQLANAKELIENIIRVTRGEGWNYSLDWKVKAKQFLKDEGCPDCFCEDCTKDCGIKELGLAEVEK